MKPARPARCADHVAGGLRRLCEARGFWLVFLTCRVLFYPDAAHVSPYAACCSAVFLKSVNPAAARRSFFRRRKAGGPPATRLSGNAPAFAVRPPARRKKTEVSSKNGSALVKQAAYGETRTAMIKKKLMKNKISVEAAAPANAVQQSSTRTGGRAPINWARRNANQVLTTDRLLALLRREAPQFFEVAEVVGKWVWIQFDRKQPATVTAVLSELGFHWNDKRQSWQHPCGLFRDQRAPFDPRQKYGSYFPADQKAA